MNSPRLAAPARSFIWMRLRPLFAATLAILLTGPLLHAASDNEVWHSVNGAQVEGRLSQVLGSLLVIAGRDRTSFVSLETLNDAELLRVADFLAAESAHKSDWPNSTTKVAKSLRGHLSKLREGKLESFTPPATAEPEIYLVYFSAGWCPPCHRFTPELVAAYHRFQEQAPGRIEVIFVSSDRSRGEQLRYAREMAMPWPVLDYSYRNHAPVIERWAGNGIPCLVAVTRDGNVVFHSYRGTEYLGPDQVVQSCERLLPVLTSKGPEFRRARHRLSVLQHVRAAGTGDCAAKPYLIALDPARFGALQLGPLTVTLDIDEQGKVRDSRFGDDVPAVVSQLFAQAAANWLFLPAVKDGQTVASTVKVPLKFEPKKSS